MLYRCLAIFLMVFIVGCVHKLSSPEDRREYADQLAAAVNWEKQMVFSQPMSLVAYVPKKKNKVNVLTVYIEGDGLAWVTRSQISSDPTPQHPTGLKMALRHPVGTAVYLARPCQYFEISDGRSCNKRYWTNDRFTADVIASTQQAIDKLMRQFGANELQLVGYSGGGAVASLVAAQRKDVIGLVTVAGNLDHKRWTKDHRITPLRGSLNPADYWENLANIPQVHFVGGQDQVVGENIARAYSSRFPDNNKPKIMIIDDFDHYCCWTQQWPKLIFSAKSYFDSRN